MKAINQAAVFAEIQIRENGITVSHKALDFQCGAFSVAQHDLLRVKKIMELHPSVVIIQELEFGGVVVLSYQGPDSLILMENKLAELARELGSEELAGMIENAYGVGYSDALVRGERLDLLAYGLAAGVLVNVVAENDLSIVCNENFFEILEESMRVQYPALVAEQTTMVVDNAKALIDGWVLKHAA